MPQPATSPKIEELRFRLKTDPKNRIFFPLAEELRKVGLVGEAEQVLRAGLTYHPAYLSAWVSLGRVLREQGKNAEAIEALSKALQIDPGNVVVARLLADTYLGTGEKVEAIKKYKLVHALMPADEELEATIERLERELNPIIPATLSPAEEAESAPAPAEDIFAPEVTAEAEQAFAPQAEAPVAEAPLERQPTLETPFATDIDDAAQALMEEEHVAVETGDAEPMAAAHAESPFEEPVPAFTTAALEIEHLQGISVEPVPLAAETASPWAAEEPADVFPPAEEPVAAPEPQLTEAMLPEPETAEPFALESEPVAAPAEEPTDTVTMADLYARQGLVAEARQIYEKILQRDPANDAVRGKLEALATTGASAAESGGSSAKVARLEQWLAKVGRREVSGV